MNEPLIPGAMASWLRSNMTFYNTAEGLAPVLASVSKRIWYHATDDMESYPFDAVIRAAMGSGEAASAPQGGEPARPKRDWFPMSEHERELEGVALVSVRILRTVRKYVTGEYRAEGVGADIAALEGIDAALAGHRIEPLEDVTEVLAALRKWEDNRDCRWGTDDWMLKVPESVVDAVVDRLAALAGAAP